MLKRIIIILVIIAIGYNWSNEIVDFNKTAHSFISENQVIQNIFGENTFYQRHFGSGSQDADDDVNVDVAISGEGINIEVSEVEVDWTKKLSYSGDGYYYSLLDLQEQALYGAVLSAYQNYEETVDLSKLYSDMSSESVHKVHWYVLLDHPEIFWVAEENSITYYDVEDSKRLESLNITNNYNLDQIASYKNALETVVASIAEYTSGAENDCEKAILVYEYLILHCDYDKDSAAIKTSETDESYGDETIESGTIIGSLINKTAVCSGYAKAFDYLLESLGIDCFSVVGYSEEVGHEWNMICLDGEYYNVDCTWGDPVLEEPDATYIAYDYFGLTTELLSTTHSLMEDIEYPVCTALDYNYYYYNELWYDTYEYETISGLFTDAIENQEDTISFCFTTADEYQIALNTLIEEDLSEIISDNKSTLDTKCSYTTIEDLNQITIKVVYK